MAKTPFSWLRGSRSFLARPALRRPIRRADAAPLRLEFLENRTLLTTWSGIATAFNNGVVTVSGKTQSLADSAFNLSIPLVRSSFSEAVDVPGKLQTPFGLKLDPNETNLDKIRTDLRSLGFTVERLEVTADGNGDLVCLSKDFSFTATQANFTVGGIGGSLGFSYFDDQVAGGLTIGTLNASVSSVTFHVTFGVDLVGTQPQLFRQDSTPDAAGKFTGTDTFNVTGQTHLSGRMNIKNLLNVQIGGDAILSLGAGLTLKSPDSNHKLHVSDLTSANVLGALTGSAKFANVSLTTQLPILPALQWTGNFIASITTNDQGQKSISRTESTVAPDIWGTFRNWVSGLFSITPSLDFLKPIASALNFKVPLFNFTLGDKLGLGDLSKITGLTANIGSDLQSAEAALNSVGIYVGIPPAAIRTTNPKRCPTSPIW